MAAKNAWGTIFYKEQESIMLTGAYYLDRPAISLQIESNRVDSLDCIFRLAYTDENVDRKKEIANIHDSGQMDVHMAILARIKRGIQYQQIEWKPGDKPIWNERTSELLKRLEFPEGIEKAKNKIDALLTVGKNVAEFNGWEEDEHLSDINSRGGKIRSVFRSIGSNQTWYLSIDVKNAKGTFELHNRKGYHEGEIKFQNGEFIPRGDDKRGKDTSGYHDIQLRREKRKPRKRHA